MARPNHIVALQLNLGICRPAGGVSSGTLEVNRPIVSLSALSAPAHQFIIVSSVATHNLNPVQSIERLSDTIYTEKERDTIETLSVVSVEKPFDILVDIEIKPTLTGFSPAKQVNELTLVSKAPQHLYAMGIPLVSIFCSLGGLSV